VQRRPGPELRAAGEVSCPASASGPGSVTAAAAQLNARGPRVRCRSATRLAGARNDEGPAVLDWAFRTLLPGPPYKRPAAPSPNGSLPTAALRPKAAGTRSWATPSTPAPRSRPPPGTDAQRTAPRAHPRSARPYPGRSLLCAWHSLPHAHFSRSWFRPEALPEPSADPESVPESRVSTVTLRPAVAARALEGCSVTSPTGPTSHRAACRTASMPLRPARHACGPRSRVTQRARREGKGRDACLRRPTSGDGAARLRPVWPGASVRCGERAISRASSSAVR
jgi:hypothetical protein